LVCIGEEEWKRLVRLIESEERGGHGSVERFVDGQGEYLGGGIREPDVCEEDEEYSLAWEIAEESVWEARSERQAVFWDEETLWGDVSPEAQRRLNTLLGR
jgi:hypothetical protein